MAHDPGLRWLIDWGDDDYAHARADVTGNINAYRVACGASLPRLHGASATGRIVLVNRDRIYSPEAAGGIGAALRSPHLAKLVDSDDVTLWEGRATLQVSLGTRAGERVLVDLEARHGPAERETHTWVHEGGIASQAAQSLAGLTGVPIECSSLQPVGVASAPRDRTLRIIGDLADWIVGVPMQTETGAWNVNALSEAAAAAPTDAFPLAHQPGDPSGALELTEYIRTHGQFATRTIVTDNSFVTIAETEVALGPDEVRSVDFALERSDSFVDVAEWDTPEIVPAPAAVTILHESPTTYCIQITAGASGDLYMVTIKGKRRRVVNGAIVTDTRTEAAAQWGERELISPPWWPSTTAGIVTRGILSLYTRSRLITAHQVSYSQRQPTAQLWRHMRDNMRIARKATFTLVDASYTAQAIDCMVARVEFQGGRAGAGPRRIVTILALPSLVAPPGVVRLDAVALGTTRAFITFYVRQETPDAETVYYRYRPVGTDDWTDATLSTASERVNTELTGLTIDTLYEIEASTDDMYAPSSRAEFRTSDAATFVLPAGTELLDLDLYGDYIIVAGFSGAASRIHVFDRAGTLQGTVASGTGVTVTGQRIRVAVDAANNRLYFTQKSTQSNRLFEVNLNPATGLPSGTPSELTTALSNTSAAIYIDGDGQIRTVGDGADFVPGDGLYQMSNTNIVRGPDGNVLFTAPGQPPITSGMGVTDDAALMFIGQSGGDAHRVRVYNRMGIEQLQ